MNLPADTAQAQLRRSVYLLLAVAGVGIMLGRILAVDAVDKRGEEKVLNADMRRDLAEKREALKKQGISPEGTAAQLKSREEYWDRRARVRRPFLSANDRSRWCTVRALVEAELRVEGAPYAIDKVLAEPNWDTIDKVRHDGHLYSSKPPLLATLVAGPYWVIHRVTGATLGTHPYAIGRFLLILVNVVPLAVYFWLLARLVERFGTTDWGRVLVMAAAVFGTFLTTFAVVLNNHVTAAVSAMVAIYAAVRIWFDGERRWRYFAIAGLFAAFTAADELPALSLLAAVTAALFWKDPRRTLAAYVPAAMVVAAAFFAANWIAHNSLRPPYVHRSETNAEDNWYEWKEPDGRYSYWHRENRRSLTGLDKGEPSPGVYALHALVGHHGIFSLTPVWILSVFGLAAWLWRPGDRRLRELALLVGAVSLACLVFYVGIVGERDRNYGGMTSGFRWVFWLAPLWLLPMLPAADATARRPWMRCVAAAMLAVSVLSASYPTWNPWTQPWLYDCFVWLGWISG